MTMKTVDFRGILFKEKVNPRGLLFAARVISQRGDPSWESTVLFLTVTPKSSPSAVALMPEELYTNASRWVMSRDLTVFLQERGLRRTKVFLSPLSFCRLLRDRAE